MNTPTDKWSAFTFSLSNPPGEGQGSVSSLLRRVADHIDSLGAIDVLDITFTAVPTDAEDDLTVTVYYGRPRIVE